MICLPAMRETMRATRVANPQSCEILSDLFHEELLETVPFLGIGRKRALLAQRCHIGLVLQVMRINAGRGRKEEASDAVLESRFV